jgi:hypothetical protein
MRMNVQDMPKNRSSRTKRKRQAVTLSAFGDAARNWRHFVIITAWIMSTALVQVPARNAPVQKLSMVPTSSSTTSEPESRVCAKIRSSS